MFVQPGGLSSLIFVVIIGVWAAYFIQYWVRRREHLATARSVDQFSESMRVLERRSPLPATDLSSPRRESYAVSPARASRPQILVKRAETPVAFATESAEPVESPVESPIGAAAPAAYSAGGPSPRGGFREEQAAPVPAPSRAPGLSLLGSLVAFVLVGVLAIFSVVPLWLLALPLLAGAGSFVWVRQTVQQARLARRAAARRPAPRQAAPVRRQAPAATAAPAAQATEPDVAEVAEVEETATEAPAARTTELYDIHAVEHPAPAATPTTPAAAAAQASPAPEAEHAAYPPAPLVDEDDIPLTWDPVPVPRPTYTMKARATRPAPTSADLVGDADTEYADTADSAEEPERRVAGA